jgi:prepilin-type processing-associated H-X9-DG protein
MTRGALKAFLIPFAAIAVTVFLSSPARAGGGLVIANAQYDVQVSASARDHASIALELIVDSTDSSQEYLRLLPADTPIRAIRADDDRTRLLRNEDDFFLYVTGKGRSRITLEFLADIKIVDGRESLILPLVKATSSEITVTAIEPDLKFDTSPKTPVEPIPSSGNSVAKIYPAGLDAITISWMPAEAARARPAVFDVREEMVLRVGPQSVRRSSQLQLNARTGSLDSVRVDVPEGVDVLDVLTTPPVRPASSRFLPEADKTRWRYVDAPEGRTIEIILAEPVTETLRLSVNCEQLVSPEMPLRVKPLVVRGATRQDGSILVEAPYDLRVVEKDSTNLVRVSVPAGPNGERPYIVCQAFEYRSVPAVLGLRVSPASPRVTASTSSHVTLQAGVVELEWRAACLIEDHAIDRIRIALPPELIPLQVTGEQIERWQVNADVMEIRFKHPVIGRCGIEIRALQNVRKINGTLIPLLHCLDAQRETGAIGISAADDVFLQHYRSDKVRQVTAAQLPDWIAMRRPKLAYAYDDPGGELAVASNLIQPELRVSTYVVAQVKEDVVQEEYIFACIIEKQPVFRLLLTLPEGLTPTNLVGDAVQDWEYHPESNAATILLNHAMTGSTAIRMYGERRLSADPSEIQLGGVAMRGAEETKGWFGVAMDANLDIRPTRATGLTPRDIRDAPSFLTAYPNLRLAYVLSGESWGLTCAASGVAPRIEARTRTALLFGRGLVRARTEIVWNISRARVRELGIELPEGSRNTSVVGRGILRTDRTGDRLEIRFTDPTDGEYQAILTYEMLMDGDGALAFREVRLPGAERQTGLVGVYAAHSDVETNIREMRGLTASQESPLQDGARALIASYTYGAPDILLRVEGKGHALAEGIRLLAEESSLDTVVKEDGQAVTYMQCRLRNSGEQFFRIALPRESVLWGTYLDGEPVKPNRLATGDLLVPLTDAPRDVPFSVGIVWAEPTPRLGMTGSFALASPLLALPAQEIRWNLHLPEEYQLIESSGNMDILRQPGFRRDSLPGRLRQAGGPLARAVRKIVIVALWIIGIAVAGIAVTFFVRWINRVNKRHRAACRAAGKKEKPRISCVGWLIALVIIAILAGLLLPALSSAREKSSRRWIPALARAREEARKANCKENLSQIGKAIFAFTQQHDEEYPDSLEDLYPQYLGSYACFACPNTEHAENEINYIYVKPAPTAPSNTPIAWDAPRNHEGGRNVLYVDGHVSWEQSPEQAKMWEMQKILGDYADESVAGHPAVFGARMKSTQNNLAQMPQAAPEAQAPSAGMPVEAWEADKDQYVTADEMKKQNIQLGESYLRQGEFESAKQAFGRALEADSESKEARAGLERLNAMRGMQLREKVEWPAAVPQRLTKGYEVGSIMSLTEQLRKSQNEEEIRRIAGNAEQSAIMDMVLSDKKAADLPENARLELRDTELAITGTDTQIEGFEQAAADLRAALLQKSREIADQARQRGEEIAQRRRAEFRQRAADQLMAGGKAGTLVGNRDAGVMPLEIRFPSFGTRPYPFRMEYAGMTQARVEVRCIRTGAAMVIQGAIGLLAFALLALLGWRSPRTAVVISAILLATCIYLLRVQTGVAVPYYTMAILGAAVAAPFWLIHWMVLFRRNMRLVSKEA